MRLELHDINNTVSDKTYKFCCHFCSSDNSALMEEKTWFHIIIILTQWPLGATLLSVSFKCVRMYYDGTS